MVWGKKRRKRPLRENTRVKETVCVRGEKEGDI
jgi:hypothetical protein